MRSCGKFFLEFWSLDGARFEFVPAALHDALGDFMDHFFEEEAEVAACAVIRGGDVFHAVGMDAELVAFFETRTGGIFGVVNRDGLPAAAPHDCEAGDIRGTVAHVNHIGKWDGAKFRGEVVVHILGHVEHAFVDTEEVLGFLGVADDAAREADATEGIFGEFASEDGADVGGEAAAFKEGLEAGGDDVVFDFDAEGGLLGGEEGVAELFEHVRQAGVEIEFCAESPEVVVGGAVHFEVVEHGLHVGQFIVEALLLDQLTAFCPETFWVDSEDGKNGLVLHVGGTQSLIVVIDDRDGGLRDGHGGWIG